jgi:aspartyl-tRNA(Asn)/glutamyl-tRNA(Gln) amidotransferase subunit A
MTALHWLSAAKASRAFAARTLSPVELLRALLDRIAALDPTLHAFIRVDAEAALAAARAAEVEMAAGHLRGPLHGVPVALKDILDVAGEPTTCHSRVMLEHVARADAAVVERLRRAGAVIVGKLALHEFAIGGPSFDLPFPPARNPWNPAHHPAGSSSGAGVAVAAGLVPLAVGTDSGGSIRGPASACGIVGLKPTFGLISRRGVFPLAPTLDTVGPLARTVADVALLTDALAGHDPLDPASAERRPGYAAVGLERGGRGLRVGFVRHFHEKDMPAEPAVAAALEEVARALAADGAQVRDVTLPPLAEFTGANYTIMYAEAWAVHAPWLTTRPGDYGRLGRQRLLAGAFLTAGDYIQAQRRRSELIAAMEEAFRHVDVLLCASAMTPPCRIDDAEAFARTNARHARAPFNLTGHPALAMLAGVSADGLPLSVQFAGRTFDEATLLRAARAWERAGGIDQLHPPEA